MAKARTRTTGRKEQLAVERFMAQHPAELAENEFLLVAKAIAGGAYSGPGLVFSADPEHVALRAAQNACPNLRLMEELQGYWRVRLLKHAMEEDDPAAYREVLERWLIGLIGRVPDGVLVPPRGTPGNTMAKNTEDIHKVWIAKGRCTPTQLAVEVDPGFLRLKPKDRDRIARAYMQRVKRLDKKLAAVTH